MIKLSNNSINFINIILDKQKTKGSIYYKKLYEYLDKFSYNISNQNIKITKKKLNIKINKNKFLSETIKNEIYKLKQYHLVTFNVNKNKVKLHIYHDQDITTFINTIIIYINYIYNLSKAKKDVTIYYYLTNYKKKMKTKILTPDQVNTGSTNMLTGVIQIWRQEEVYKTTIHELIHLFHLDGFHCLELSEYYKKKYQCTSQDVLINEAVTDFWAILINIFLTTKLVNKSYDEFVLFINCEKTFIKYQAQKILNLNKNYNLYTNVLSYYVVKAELFENLSRTLKIIDVKINNYNKLYKYLQTIKKIQQNKNINDKTLRMSIIELNV